MIQQTCPESKRGCLVPRTARIGNLRLTSDTIRIPAWRALNGSPWKVPLPNGVVLKPRHLTQIQRAAGGRLQRRRQWRRRHCRRDLGDRASARNISATVGVRRPVRDTSRMAHGPRCRNHISRQKQERSATATGTAAHRPKFTGRHDDSGARCLLEQGPTRCERGAGGHCFWRQPACDGSGERRRWAAPIRSPGQRAAEAALPLSRQAWTTPPARLICGNR